MAYPGAGTAGSKERRATGCLDLVVYWAHSGPVVMDWLAVYLDARTGESTERWSMGVLDLVEYWAKFGPVVPAEGYTTGTGVAGTMDGLGLRLVAL